MLGAQILEFSPDVTNAMKRHHQAALARKAAAKAAANPGSGQPVIVQPGAPVPPPAPKP
jgi:hypothetical protein